MCDDRGEGGATCSGARLLIAPVGTNQVSGRISIAINDEALLTALLCHLPDKYLFNKKAIFRFINVAVLDDPHKIRRHAKLQGFAIACFTGLPAFMGYVIVNGMAKTGDLLAGNKQNNSSNNHNWQQFVAA